MTVAELIKRLNLLLTDKPDFSDKAVRLYVSEFGTCYDSSAEAQILEVHHDAVIIRSWETLDENTISAHKSPTARLAEQAEEDHRIRKLELSGTTIAG